MRRFPDRFELLSPKGDLSVLQPYEDQEVLLGTNGDWLPTTRERQFNDDHFEIIGLICNDVEDRGFVEWSKSPTNADVAIARAIARDIGSVIESGLRSRGSPPDLARVAIGRTVLTASGAIQPEGFLGLTLVDESNRAFRRVVTGTPAPRPAHFYVPIH